MKRLLLYFVAMVTLLSQSSCGYNGMVQRDQAVKSQWANVQSAYQRRSDLIPNLVNTVKGAANFEKSTLEGVIEARAKATSVQLSADQLTPENLQKFQAAQSQLSSGLGRLLAVSENYPELKANANFQELQAQIEGTENRINVERNKFNGDVNDYNTFTRSFPNNLFAGMFGFPPKGYFEADASAKDAPKVDFGDMGGGNTPAGSK
ncbi:LemA family protein [Hymenobacter sp. UV11]|uniref:LemA family protein n=1 Tax=Hymenobacter sp. UV11 TaxID=1849735 RepID=UPI00105DD5AB|nr:LemA family protein [Hymenobacter sp. UV11]TDN39995.1 LemA family protein [Hymenobacter sp. UV11]TFZ64095.1 LemA family protein [Hymenobacter sp. UV11]